MAGWLLRPARASFLRRAARPAILKRLNVRASQRAATLASARARRYRAFTTNRTTKSPAWKRRYPVESDKVFWGSPIRSEEQKSELQSLMRISYAVFCLKKKKENK